MILTDLHPVEGQDRQCFLRTPGRVPYPYKILRSLNAKNWEFLYSTYVYQKETVPLIHSYTLQPSHWCCDVTVLLNMHSVNLKLPSQTASQHKQWLPQITSHSQSRNCSWCVRTGWNWQRRMLNKTWSFPTAFFAVRWAIAAILWP